MFSSRASSLSQVATRLKLFWGGSFLNAEGNAQVPASRRSRFASQCPTLRFFAVFATWRETYPREAEGSRKGAEDRGRRLLTRRSRAIT